MTDANLIDTFKPQAIKSLLTTKAGVSQNIPGLWKAASLECPTHHWSSCTWNRTGTAKWHSLDGMGGGGTWPGSTVASPPTPCPKHKHEMLCLPNRKKSITLKTSAPTEELPNTHRHQPQIYLRLQLTYQNPWRGWPGTCAACPACIHRHFSQHPQHGQEKHIPERCTWARRQAACTRVP